MTLTLEVPMNVEQGKLQRAAIAMYDAHLLTQGQAAEMAGLSRPDFIEALIREGVSVIQYESADEILAEAALLAAHS
jgi:predicted HTH domain antitoxin